MARVHGKSANYSFNGVAIEDSLTEMTQVATAPEADITAFADAWQNFLAGKKAVTMELSGSYDPGAAKSDATLFAGFGAGPLSTVFQPNGDTTGEYTCTLSGLAGALVENYTISLPVGDKGSFRASIRNSYNTVRT